MNQQKLSPALLDGIYQSLQRIKQSSVVLDKEYNYENTITRLDLIFRNIIRANFEISQITTADFNAIDEIYLKYASLAPYTPKIISIRSYFEEKCKQKLLSSFSAIENSVTILINQLRIIESSSILEPNSLSEVTTLESFPTAELINLIAYLDCHITAIQPEKTTKPAEIQNFKTESHSHFETLLTLIRLRPYLLQFTENLCNLRYILYQNVITSYVKSYEAIFSNDSNDV